MVISTQNELITVKADPAELEGLLQLPQHPLGIVLFAHGSGSSRLSPRNNYIAGMLHEVGLGTLLMDLLTQEDQGDQSDQSYGLAQSRFNIALLAQRLDASVDWLQHYGDTRSLPVGLFGASTGTAAALQVAASRGPEIAAIVSCGGRPDLVGQRALQKVVAPTLFTVGELDEVVIRLNKAAYAALHCVKRFEIVPGASHLFEEPGKLEAVAELARSWFLRYLARTANKQAAKE